MNNVIELEVDWSETCYSAVYLKDEAEPLRVLAHTGKGEEHRWYTLAEGIVEYKGKLWAAMLPDHLDEGGHASWNDILEGCKLELVEVTPEQVITTQYKAVELPDSPKPCDLVRPSSLPKLAVCRCFVGKEGTSEAAERGTRLDAAIRKAVAAGTSVDPADVDCVDEDVEACNWAIDELKTLRISGKWETRESELQAVVPVEGVKPGTMDALNVEDATLADFKTGQVRNYREQMAAYALACMEAYFEDRWTCFLLFVDAKEVVTHIFTREEAEAIVLDVLMAKRKENPCEYCAWCARFDGECPVYGTCGAVKAANAEVLNADLPKPTPALLSHPDEWPESVKELAKDHAKAFRFLQCLDIAKKWGDQIKTELKKQDELPPRYFKRVTMSGQRKVYASQLVSIAERWGVDEVLALCGLISYAEFEKAWKEHEGEDTPIPDGLVGTFGGSVQIRLGTGEDPKASAAAKGSGVTRKKSTKKETK